MNDGINRVSYAKKKTIIEFEVNTITPAKVMSFKNNAKLRISSR